MGVYDPAIHSDGGIAPDARFLSVFMPELVRLKAFLRSNVHRQSDADDLLQEISLVVWRRFEHYDPQRPFRPWLFGVARNVLREYMRKRDGRVLMFDETIHAEMERVVCDDRSEDREAMRLCIAKLDELSQQLLRWRYDDNLPLEELTDRTGKSVKAVSKTLGRIRVLLGECIRRQVDKATPL